VFINRQNALRSSEVNIETNDELSGKWSIKSNYRNFRDRGDSFGLETISTQTPIFFKTRTEEDKIQK